MTVNLNEAFDTYQRTVDADPEQVALARERRDVFKKALQAEGDVLEVFGSGSLRRSTQLKPVHDVDLVVVFDDAEHPDWGSPGSSSDDALDHVGGRVNKLLGRTNGSVDQLVRLATPHDRAVKCFIDPPDQEDAFTVDVMPVFRQADRTLLLPSTRQKHGPPPIRST